MIHQLYLKYVYLLKFNYLLLLSISYYVSLFIILSNIL